MRQNVNKWVAREKNIVFFCAQCIMMTQKKSAEKLRARKWRFKEAFLKSAQTLSDTFSAFFPFSQPL